MKKIFIIILLLVLSFSVGFFVIRSNSERIAQVIKNNSEGEQQSELQNGEQNNNTEVEENIDSQEDVTKEIIPTENEKQAIGETKTKEINNKNVETNNVVNKKQETKKVEPQENKVQEQKKEEQPVIIKSETQETKQEVKQTQGNKVKQCTNDKHMIETGNSKRWFKTEQEAINLYDKLQKEWSDKLTSGVATEKEYDANCPYGYETWDCPNCQKWTINFYYR